MSAASFFFSFFDLASAARPLHKTLKPQSRLSPLPTPRACTSSRSFKMAFALSAPCRLPVRNIGEEAARGSEARFHSRAPPVELSALLPLFLFFACLVLCSPSLSRLAPTPFLQAHTVSLSLPAPSPFPRSLAQVRRPNCPSRGRQGLRQVRERENSCCGTSTRGGKGHWFFLSSLSSIGLPLLLTPPAVSLPVAFFPGAGRSALARAFRSRQGSISSPVASEAQSLTELSLSRGRKGV